MQHLNPPPFQAPTDDRPKTGFTALEREDEIRRLEVILGELQAKRQSILDAIEVKHAEMTNRVHTAVREYERLFWEADPQTQETMARINELRAENDPLRKDVWYVQGLIRDLKAKGGA